VSEITAEELYEAEEAAFEAGVQAERERACELIEGLRINAPAWPKDDSYEAGLDAALAVVTGKEGASNV